MQESQPQARRGMVKFVITIFLIAIVIAGIYLLGFTPGEA